ncbi:hypothetical protein Lalb_Chr14g0364761 [Lupinus albus]|uniref:Uncharacterized protein n=1 Tax=Lupinus albus TaxID=3870 RepID=A0A6A4PBI8_LUPAL|nr:hypothetical protein Lalb_Chr14g0364761 [Lupinus albus]
MSWLETWCNLLSSPFTSSSVGQLRKPRKSKRSKLCDKGAVSIARSKPRLMLLMFTRLVEAD